ncbi:MAG: hypothetical protein ABI405_01020 [Parafilimonas sp.]
MSDKLPFEDAFKNKMDDLPAGDEDAAWQKMKELLEEKDKRKPFAWLNIYTICSSIIILVAFSIWISLSGIGGKQKTISKTENNSVSKKNTFNNKQMKSNETPDETNKISAQKNKADTFSKQMNSEVTELNTIHNRHISLYQNKKLKNFKKQLSVEANKNFTEDTNTALVDKKDNNNAISITSIDSLQNINADKVVITKSDTVNKSAEPSLSATAKIDSAKNETAAANTLMQSLNSDTSSIKKQLPISLKQKHFFVEAGIQLKQQIPIGGQKIIAYNYSGDKQLFKDYIPSFFIRFEKGKQWFLQAEFSYATPNLIKQFSYSRQTKADYSLSTVTVITASLQKNYYSKIPLSFNYYVKPHWSIGTGIIYNWFHGAVAEQETTTNDIKAGTFNTVKTMMPFKNFTDSFLYKNQASLLLQTGYSLKRWSFILRYEKGIQPYIKYTLPDGTIESRKISSLELNIGYRFIKKPF